MPSKGWNSSGSALVPETRKFVSCVLFLHCLKTLVAQSEDRGRGGMELCLEGYETCCRITSCSSHTARQAQMKKQYFRDVISVFVVVETGLGLSKPICWVSPSPPIGLGRLGLGLDMMVWTALHLVPPVCSWSWSTLVSDCLVLTTTLDVIHPPRSTW